MKQSYDEIVLLDAAAHDECPYDWECEVCGRELCIRLVGVADFPSTSGDFKILAFYNNKDEKDHIALVKGDVRSEESVLTRLHSSCLTGDALGSERCDCGLQLHVALNRIDREGLGILLYMQQEGRGIGLANKIKAYQLQDKGLDTFDANLHLGFGPDQRDYDISAAILAKLGVKSIRLLTNNPDKVKQLRSYGVDIVEQVPLEVPANENNLKYMLAKKKRFGHKLSLQNEERQEQTDDGAVNTQKKR